MGSPHGDGSRFQEASQQGGRKVTEFQSELKRLLAKHGVFTDKRFGQHFLVSTRVVGAITGAASGLAGVLEIGPGPGVLTRFLVEGGVSVTAVELDRRVLPVLEEFAPGAAVLSADALAMDWEALLSDLPLPRGIVSNMPYNITGPLLERVAGVSGLIDRAVLMMQKEVADKIMALPGDRTRGAVSVNLQSVFRISSVCGAPAGCFMPPPKVDSSVLLFVPREDRLEGVERERFERVVRAGFRMPRKTLVNNLKGVVHLDGLGLKESVRPHELTEDEWRRVASRASE